MDEFQSVLNLIKQYPNLEAAKDAVPNLKEIIDSIPGLKDYILESNDFWIYKAMPKSREVREAILDGVAKNCGKAVERIDKKIAEHMILVDDIKDKVDVTDITSNPINAASKVASASSTVGLAISASTISVIAAVAIGVCYLNYKLNKAVDKHSIEMKEEFKKINEKLDDIKTNQWNNDIYGPFKKTLEKLPMDMKNKNRDGIEIALNDLWNIKTKTVKYANDYLKKDIASFTEHLDEFKSTLFIAFVSMHNLVNCTLALGKNEEAAELLKMCKKEFLELKASYEKLFTGNSAVLSTVPLDSVSNIADIKKGFEEMYETLIEKNLLIAQLSFYELPYFEYEAYSTKLLEEQLA